MAMEAIDNCQVNLVRSASPARSAIAIVDVEKIPGSFLVDDVRLRNETQPTRSAIAFNTIYESREK